MADLLHTTKTTILGRQPIQLSSHVSILAADSYLSIKYPGIIILILDLIQPLVIVAKE